MLRNLSSFLDNVPFALQVRNAQPHLICPKLAVMVSGVLQDRPLVRPVQPATIVPQRLTFLSFARWEHTLSLVKSLVQAAVQR
jgi:hypothetical protein